MKERVFTVVNRLGLHARAAVRLVLLANRYRSEVLLSREGQEVNGKSIMGVLTLAAAKGSRIRVRAEGPDEDEAMDALEALFGSGFGEDLG